MADEAPVEIPTLDGLKSKKFWLTLLAFLLGIAMQIRSVYPANQYVQIALAVCGTALQILTILGYNKANVIEKVGIATANASVLAAAAGVPQANPPVAKL